MTQPLSTSLTPSSPPLPSAPPAFPFAPQTGAMGSRIVALKCMNSESSGVEADLSRRLEVDAIAVVVLGGKEERRRYKEGQEMKQKIKSRWAFGSSSLPSAPRLGTTPVCHACHAAVPSDLPHQGHNQPCRGQSTLPLQKL